MPEPFHVAVQKSQIAFNKDTSQVRFSYALEMAEPQRAHFHFLPSRIRVRFNQLVFSHFYLGAFIRTARLEEKCVA